MEAPSVVLEREALEPALPSDVKPPGASLRWRWSSPATQVLPLDSVPPPWLSPARAAPPPAAAPAPAPAREASAELEEYSSWHALPEELVEAVMRLLDAQLRDWPERGSLLAACGVCRAWRRVGLHAFAPARWSPAAPEADWATPARLLVPGPAGTHMKCYIQRERVKGSLKRRYLLFLGAGDGYQRGKLLLCAARSPSALCSVYDISTSQSGEPAAVVAQLRSNFFGTQFHIIQRDSVTAACAATFVPPGAAPPAPPAQLPSWPEATAEAEAEAAAAEAVAAEAAEEDSGATSGGESLSSRPASPDGLAAAAAALSISPPSSPRAASPPPAAQQQAPAVGGSTVVGALSYDCNIWAQRGPRRMAVALSNPLLAALPPPAAAAGDGDAEEGGAEGAPQQPTQPEAEEQPEQGNALLPPATPSIDFALLRNKAPRWHDAYQCWCLDFGGRVTQASVKNFQLVAQGSSRVLMQFGRTSHKDIFVMDYEHPLSAVQAFAVCLSAFDTKLACR